MSLIVVGVINSEGTLWKDERKFLHNTLRNLGMTYMSTGKKFMEMRIMVSVLYLSIRVASNIFEF